MSGSQGYKIPEGSDPSLANPGNTSHLKGSTGGARTGEFSSDLQNAGTLQPDFTLANTKADAKGQETTYPITEADNEQAPTAGSNRHRETLQSHEMDVPGNDPHNPIKPLRGGEHHAGPY